MIRKLKEIPKEKHPLKQLKIISEAKSLITHEIDVFYQSDKRRKHFCLDAEQINRILAYVVLESGLTDLIAVIQLIEDFTTSEVQESRLGQALVSLKTAAGMLVGGGAAQLLGAESFNQDAACSACAELPPLYPF